MSNPLAESPSGSTVQQPRSTCCAGTTPLIDRLGHDPRSRYVERFWLGILGPSTTLVLRVSPMRSTKRRCGPSRSRRRCRPDRCRSPRRAQQPALPVDSAGDPVRGARSAGADSIEVRHRLAPLNRSQIERLPLALQAEHQHLPNSRSCRSRSFAGTPPALSLIECGDGFAETERQLDQWRVPGPIAAEAVNWAWERHRVAAEHGPEAA